MCLSLELSRTGRLRSASLLALVAWGLGLAGCSPFDKPQTLTQTSRKLPALQPPPGSMQLDVAYIEWPADDPQLGPQLWRHVDQVGPVDAETRMRLRQNGFRVGIVGTNPPAALQRMLGLKSDFASEPDAEQTKQFTGRRVFLISGGETEVQVSNLYPECTVSLPADGASEPRRFENAICKYRIRAFRIQDGWARLEFTPQINHGDDQLRYAVGEEMHWQHQSGQLTESFRPQRFTIEVKAGDMAIITAEDVCPATLGQLFFRGPAALQRSRDQEGATPSSEYRGEQPLPPETEYPIQRLLIVRLAGMDYLEPVRVSGK
jgi:hypothetical protein